MDIIEKAKREIRIFGRISLATGEALISELEKARSDAENGAKWFNSYQAVDDFLLHHIGAENFGTGHDLPEKNTIDAICVLAGLNT